MTDQESPESLDEVARLLRAAGPRPSVPEERSLRVRAAVHEHWRYTLDARKRMRWLIFSVVPLAAALIVMFASGIWHSVQKSPSPRAPIATLERSEGPVLWLDRAVPEIGASLDAGTAFDTGPAGRLALRLNGGASLRIDVGSAVRLLSDAECLLERGAVYVDTGIGAQETTVTVRTSLGTVRDVGTQFQVRASDGALRLSVRQGTATLEHDGRRHEAPPGTQITVGHDGSVTSGPVSSSGAEWEWIQDAAPMFHLEGSRLGEYLDWIARETGLRIRYAEDSIPASTSAVVLHGSLVGLRPDETLEAVLPTCGLRHRISEGFLIIDRTSR